MKAEVIIHRNSHILWKYFEGQTYFLDFQLALWKSSCQILLAQGKLAHLLPYPLLIRQVRVKKQLLWQINLVVPHDWMALFSQPDFVDLNEGIGPYLW